MLDIYERREWDEDDIKFMVGDQLREIFQNAYIGACIT